MIQLRYLPPVPADRHNVRRQRIAKRKGFEDVPAVVEMPIMC